MLILNDAYLNKIKAPKSQEHCSLKVKAKLTALSLVTQPMLQRRPNWTELRSMGSYIQILCRFQKCKQKVPPPSLLSNEKSPFTFKEDFSHPLGE